MCFFGTELLRNWAGQKPHPTREISNKYLNAVSQIINKTRTIRLNQYVAKDNED